MSDNYEFHRETRGDITLRYFWEYDNECRMPWDDEIMAGCVKRSDDPPEPWERILSEETRGYHQENLLFDGRLFVEKAIKDGGCSREQAAGQLEYAFERCKSWLNNEWHYVGVTVRAFDEDDEDITPDDVCDSAWGIENDHEPWMIEIGNDIAAEIMASLRPELKEAA